MGSRGYLIRRPSTARPPLSESGPPAIERARRFAELVERLVREPEAVLAHRAAATALARLLAVEGVTLRTDAEGIVVDETPVDLPLLAARLQTYGVEELSLTPETAMADLLEVARLVAAEPSGPDPAAMFAARAAVLDPVAIPRRFRAADATFTPLLTERDRRASGAILKVPTPQVVEAPLNATRLTIGGAPMLTPARSSEQLQPLAAAAARASTALPALPEPTAADGTVVPVPRLSRALPRTSRATRTVAAVTRTRRARSEALRGTGPLEPPTPRDPALANALAACAASVDDEGFTAAVDALAWAAGLAARQGRDADALDGLLALVALESRYIDATEGAPRLRRLGAAFTRAATAPLLHHLAGLRRAPADATETARLDLALARAGMDGAAALVTSCLTAAAPSSLAAALEALRAHPRAHEALEEIATDGRSLALREAAALLGALGDATAEVILTAALAHPDPLARAAVVSALGGLESVSSLNTVTTALADRAAVVRARALAALGRRRPDGLALRVRALVDGEVEPAIWAAAVDLLGVTATTDGVELLIDVANGAGRHPDAATAAHRIAACRALAVARVPTGMTTLEALRSDPDETVRDAVGAMLAVARRRATASELPAVTD
ncbi:MAG: hypothetical protein RL340_471 [Gemmatimonadota bacterium]